MTEYTVKPEEAGRKARDILRRSMGVSYTALKSARWNNRIRVNGESARADRTVEAGDTVSISWAEDEPAYRPKPFDLPLEIPYRDEYMAVVVKPAGIASQSSRNHPDDSLENALYALEGCPERFVYRPVNRLDKGTGGLMLVALDPHTQHLAQRMLHTEAFERRYLALTEGEPPADAGVIDLPIAKEDAASVRREIRADGKPAVTRYRVLEKRGGRSLLLLKLETGRTHQIRVHLRAIGCPVCGDFLYGTELPEEFPGCFALHSAGIRVRHPVSGEPMAWTSVPAWAGIPGDSVLSVDFR